MIDNLYQAQTDGKLAELSNNIISGFGDIFDDPYYDIVPASMRVTNVETDLLPIKLLERGLSVSVGGKSVNPVVLIDPTPIDSAIITTPAPAPANGFYSPVTYRGGFAPGENWLAVGPADEFGLLFGTSSGDCGSCQGDADGNGKVEFWDLVEVLQTGDAKANQNICCLYSCVRMHSILLMLLPLLQAINSPFQGDSVSTNDGNS